MALRFSSLFLALALLALPAFAQTAPDAGSLLRSIEKSTPPPTPAPQLGGATGEAAPAARESGVKVLVKDFDLQARQFPASELKEVVKGYIGRELTLAELQKAAMKISDYYRDKGFMARAYLPKQKIHNGVVKIIVLEGKLGSIRIDPKSKSRLDPDLAKGFIESRMPAGQLLRPGDLREGVLVLNELPGVSAASSLQKGKQDGETDAVIKLEDGPLLSGAVSADNAGVRSVGSKRGIATLSLNDALGMGDQLSFIGVASGFSQYARMAATAPVGTSGFALGANIAGLRYNVDHDFNSANQNGYALVFGATASYPIIRSSSFSLSADSAFDHKRLVNFSLGLNTSDKDVDVGEVGVSGIASDDVLAGAVNTFGGSLSAGSLDLSANAGNLTQDQASARTNGVYSKVAARAARLQNFDETHQLFVSASGQLAPTNLDSSEQFSLGGPQGVRAYPVNEGLGDLGFLGRVELRHNLMEGFQLFELYDAGWIAQHENTWAGWNAGNPQPNSYWLQGAGIGANWTPLLGMQLAATLAHTIGNNPGRALNGD
ncbi:MAG TPA: ShlB/FhaC/HecB family hemolysin secretion/activation protein, partial [Alphaproteobacteria bacterium]|nr:ShlB/FhaC/HecB family hemolysin secretion/activation protein [Alphaproteobacteria bacterium]